MLCVVYEYILDVVRVNVLFIIKRLRFMVKIGRDDNFFFSRDIYKWQETFFGSMK